MEIAKGMEIRRYMIVQKNERYVFLRQNRSSRDKAD